MLSVAAGFAIMEHDVALAKVLEERHDEFEAGKMTTLRSKATFAKMRDKKSAEIKNLRSDRDSAGARHHELLASIRRDFMTHEERKDKTAGTFLKLRRV